MTWAEKNAIKARCSGNTLSSAFLWEATVSVNSLLKSQWLYPMRPRPVCSTIFKASLSDFTAFTERPHQSRRKCVFCCFLAHLSAWFYQAAAQHFCPERRLVNWIPFPRVTLDPLMSRQLNYLLQPLFLPKRFRLRLGHTPLKLFFEILWKASWRI